VVAGSARGCCAGCSAASNVRIARALRILACLASLAACKGKGKAARTEETAPAPPAVPADALARDASGAWPELASYPPAEPERVIAIPTRPDVPRFDVGGPVLVGDLAIVASSQLGFAAVDWRRGAITWTKPAGHHVAPPLVHDGSIVLVGECLSPPPVPADETLLGCLRVVTPTGADQAYAAVRGKTKLVAAFAGSPGRQALWSAGERAVRWRRGDEAVTIDLVSGVAKPALAGPPPLVVVHRDRRWEITQDEGRIIATGKDGTPSWRTEHPYTALLGSVALPEMSPILRVVNIGAWAGSPEVQVIDMDATGSLHAAVARPTPGIALLGHAVSPVGDAALAVRMDRSIRRDFIAGYAANAMIVWVYPLPEVPRADPVGVAVAPDAVVVFHDGDTLTILPALSAPPTAPGAPAPPSRNPTP